MIAGIILCAGSSSRMGSPKALLKIGEKPFVQHIVDILHSARILDIAIVLGDKYDEIKQQLNWFSGKIVINEEWQNGQLSSLLKGLECFEHEDYHGVMICPVDCPLFTQSVLVDLLQAFWKSRKGIIVPVYNHKRGHPVIFARIMYDKLKNADPTVGARDVLRKNPDEVFEVESNEEGILINIDTLEAYEEYIINRFRYDQII